MVMSVHTKEEVFDILNSIPDPEIPVLNIREMGMLRDVHITDKGYEIVLTPTYTGCPAMGMIEDDIKARLRERSVFPVVVKMVNEPAWTTEWMSDQAKEKLRQYGIAPPVKLVCSNLKFEQNNIPCPRCESKNTVMLSRFGSTACKALYKCSDCKEPFEYFKCH